MAYFGDYHTHSVHSHGTGSIEDNIVAAIEKGLKEIAITDHGFKHLAYNVHRREFIKISEQANVLKEKYKDKIKLYFGLETNFNSADGNIDIKQSDMPLLDIVICGYHKFVAPFHFGDFFTFFLPNFVLDSIGKSTKRQIARNTDAYLKALDKFDIDIISHMNYGIKVDVEEVVKACIHYGTKVELNGKRVNMADEEIERAAELGAEFIVNSDAHSSDRVGDFSVGEEVIKRLKIPYSMVCNYDRVPTFRSVLAKQKAAEKI